MTNTKEKQKLIDDFFAMVDSLKKCRRADLSDINGDNDIIEKLYVDPLPNDFVLKSSLRPNTTVLIGRKGTGKSTIIARIQHEIRKSTDKLSLYLDVKTIFDQSRTFNYNSSSFENVLNQEELDKYLLFKSFLKLIINQINEEVQVNSLKFYIGAITKIFGHDEKVFRKEIGDIFKLIDEKENEDILILKQKLINSSLSDQNEQAQSIEAEIKTKISSIPSAEGKIKTTESEKNTSTDKLDEAFSEVLLQYYEPHKILLKVKKVLQKIGIKNVFICLDDFSEIDEGAMKVFVDTIVAPLNNWSEEFFKFKIAGYPNRVYLGDIDPQKIEQIKLDYYDLYQSAKVSESEKSALENIEKLITKRCKYFCDSAPTGFFNGSDKIPMEQFYRVLFYSTSNVPRNIGWVLWYAFQNSISKGKKINLQDLQLASERFYTDTVQVFFSKNKYMKQAFNERLEKFHLHEILTNLISSSKTNKTEIGKSDSKIFQADKSKPPTSHFYIDKNLEEVLSTLELNYFITKYSEQKDQDGKVLMSFYTLNHGLCQSEDIHYGKGSDRKYVIQRRFNYSDIVRSYISSAKQFVCNNCENTLPYENRAGLEMFDMLCPKCKKGTCELEHVEVELPAEDQSIQLPAIDLNLLNSLNIEEPQSPSSIAQEIDTSYQKISKRASKLEEGGLVSIQRKVYVPKVGLRTLYQLTEIAKNLYFKK